ncbi:hypothetical protein DFH05DRAFT_1512377 [Lentinula detonsa]|uniref:DUF6533 domain-containing protein n=1 Tax=Lentinula detonsa TaxID=2804962 RepID=A0A9W8NS77_9AGAR|nr:hypothetical protein DFH05DRAFT_1512377 [Lentinula detonsa]
MSALSKEALMASLEGLEIARTVNTACSVLAVYEWMITLDQEIEYFWTGKWSLERILFFCNRYISPFLVMFGLIEFFIPNPSNKVRFCTSAVQFSFIASILALGVIQAMLILRIWYLFPDRQSIQYGMIILWVCSMTISLAYTGLIMKSLRLLDREAFPLGPGCRVARPVKFWRMFMPSLGLHTVLYILTAMRALRNRRLLMDAPVLKRLIRDGGLFFFVVFISVGFNTLGSFLEHVPQINIPVIFSNYLLAVTSIAMSRIMFSIHSLASHLGSETGWLLSNVELRRVNWRKGATEGELIVECTSSGQEDNCFDLESTLHPSDGTVRSQSALKVSRVGMYNDDTIWS